MNGVFTICLVYVNKEIIILLLLLLLFIFLYFISKVRDFVWFYFVTLCDWLTKTGTTYSTNAIRIKTKTNRDSFELIFLIFLRRCFVFASGSDWFIALFSTVVIGQSKFLRFWSDDNQLKIALNLCCNKFLMFSIRRVPRLSEDTYQQQQQKKNNSNQERRKACVHVHVCERIFFFNFILIR